jgi:hypothetical protein
MRVILSRKGFDTSYGGVPSPILEDGRMIMLPIPAEEGEDRRTKYSELYYGRNERIVDLMKSLGIGSYKSPGQSYEFRSKDARAHVDPDLIRITLRSRNPGWKPLFGPTGTKFPLLDKNVGIDDLFLFFGWYQKVKSNGDKLRYDPDDFSTSNRGKHRIFGYFQVGSVLNVDEDRLPKWTSYHAHVGVKGVEKFKPNIVYVAKPSLTFASELPGAGTFEYEERKEENLATKLTLTKPGHAMSEWELPFAGVKCWNSPEKWLTKTSRHGFFKSPDIGQELLWEQNPSVEEWAKKLIFAHKIRK